MNQEYDVLLEKFLEGSISESEKSAMDRMELEDPELADMRMAHEALQDELQSLGADVPEIPPDFHAAWTAKIEEASMQDKKQPRINRHLIRILSAAAALVLLAGGTILARDALPPRTVSTSSSDPYVVQRKSAPEAAAYGTGSSMDSGNYYAMDMAAEETMLSGADYDVPEEEADESASASEQQKIIRTGNIALSTTNFDATMQELQQMISQFGGTVTWSSVSTGYNGLHTASLTIRLPSENFEAFFASSPASCTITSQSQQVDDVTESYRDREARLATQKAMMERLKELVGQAGSLSDLLELESQIADTQYQIDTLTASLTRTDLQVAQSTISVSIKEEKPQNTISHTSLSFGERISRAFTGGLSAFGEFMEDMLLFVTAALPYLLMIGIVIVVIVLICRRRRKNRT